MSVPPISPVYTDETSGIPTADNIRYIGECPDCPDVNIDCPDVVCPDCPQFPSWEIDQTWWSPSGNAVNGSAFEVKGQIRGGGDITVWGANLGSAGNTMNVWQGQLTGVFTAGGGAVSARVTPGWSAYVNIQKYGIPAGTPAPDHVRCAIWTFPVAWASDLANTDESGLVLQLWDGTAGGWIRAGNNGIGIVRNGSGAWRYVSKRTTGVSTYAESVDLTWPAAVTEFTTVDLVIKAANGDRDGVFQLWLNGQMTLERNWAGGLLPIFGDSGVPANAGRWFAHARSGDSSVGGALLLGPGRFRVGKYDPAGVEVT